MAEDLLRLATYDSKAVITLSTRAPGVYIQKLAVAGNSVLSSVFVESLDGGASVLVEYFDFGVGGDVGEAYPLNSHDPVTTATTTDRKLISGIHDKPYLKCTVSGGNVRFGVYATVVVSTATDIDNALQREGDSVLLSVDKGMPVMVYDEANGEWKFARGEDGIQDVRVVGNVAIGEPGEPVFADYAGTSTPGTEQTLISYTVPVGKTLNLLAVYVISRQESSFRIEGDSALIGSGRTGPANPMGLFEYRIARSFSAGKLINIKASVRASAPPADIECFMQGTLS